MGFALIFQNPHRRRRAALAGGLFDRGIYLGELSVKIAHEASLKADSESTSAALPATARLPSRACPMCALARQP